MTETKSEYRCETCDYKDDKNGGQCPAWCRNRSLVEITGCFAHSAINARKYPPYQDLIDHIRWTQNLWRHGIVIMRKNNLVIASDTPMEKLAFTFYMDLCEIDSRALHLFGEGAGDENYKDQTAIQAQTIVPYPRPYEEAIRKDEREKCLLLTIGRISKEREEILQFVRSFCISTNCTNDCGPCKLSRAIGILNQDPKLLFGFLHPATPAQEPPHGP